MTTKYIIVKENVPTTYIGNDGNLHHHNNDYKYFLKNEKDEIISHQYYCMIDLGNDHFGVCDVKDDIDFFTNYNYYHIIHNEYCINESKLKWGIIRINRDEQNNIIPKAETLIVPFIYDRISENNLKTATVYANGKVTYFDIDIMSDNYGKQLVPCILDYAVPFGNDNFAECSVNNVRGYLPRNCQSKEHLKSNELLTTIQIIYLSDYINDEKEITLPKDIILKYFNLTGELPSPEQHKTLKKQLSKK